MCIRDRENQLGVIVQFGGQTPLNIAAELERRGAHILGTSPAVIDMAEDRDPVSYTHLQGPEVPWYPDIRIWYPL